MTRAFIDTNVIVYAHVDIHDQRSATARDLIFTLSGTDSAVISIQVLNELFFTAVRKFKLSRTIARDMVRSLDGLVVIDLTRSITRMAQDIAVDHQFTIYDSLVIAAAKSAGCDRIYTEDLTHNQVVQGIKIINPFLEQATPS